jgi:hypothetical protein
VALNVAGYSQEALVGLNGVRVSATADKAVKVNSSVTAVLPFVDDFSQRGRVTPNPSLWATGDAVFVNRFFAVNPPTVGVATFDPFDAEGQVYSGAAGESFAADTLESVAIDLNYRLSDSVYLSFYLQPQGYGDLPEEKDSIAVQFYSPADDAWFNVWSASVVSEAEIVVRNYLNGSTASLSGDSLGAQFFKVLLRIDDTRYLVDGFRLRFVNYASINVNPAFPGRSTATDHWHLDCVYLDKDRCLQTYDIPDIGLTCDAASIMKTYTAVPATHFSAAKGDLFDNPLTLTLNYANLGWGVRSVNRNFRLRTLYGGAGRTLSYSAGAENISDGVVIDLSYPVPEYGFTINGDSAAFEVMSWLDTDNDLSDFRRTLRYNDTSVVVYSFKDCYAYDDGTAENGYGLYGAGVSQGKVAVKFTSYLADSLRGVYLYFNHALNDANERHRFKLAVWDDANGIPGEILHNDDTIRPQFGGGLNQFALFKFSRPVPLREGATFYVGWLQTDEGYLNVGFDRNTNSKDKLFYNLGQTWERSAFDGSLMLRPVFCRDGSAFPDGATELQPEQPTASAQQSFKVYPNPVNGVMYLADGDESPLLSQRIELFDLSGRLLKVFENVSGNIDLSNVATGIYLLRVSDRNRRILGTKRIIVQ